MTALQAILCGDIQKNVEHREEELKTYDELWSGVVKWAINKKIENERTCFDPMDCNLAGGNRQEEDWWNAGWPTTEQPAQPNIDIDDARKGKGDGKGKRKAKECSSEETE